MFDRILAAIVSIGGILLGADLLRWAISGLVRGEIRYRLKKYDRVTQPFHYWAAVVWGLGMGFLFVLGGPVLFFLVVTR